MSTLRRFLLAALAALALAGLCAPAAPAAFGLDNLGLRFEDEAGGAAMQAGAHPYALTQTLGVHTKVLGGKVVPDGEIEDLQISLPEGLVGNPTAVQRCSGADFLVIPIPACPDSTVLGVAKANLSNFGAEPTQAPVYNLQPGPGAVAKIGFLVEVVPVVVDLKLNPDPPYNVVASLEKIPSQVLPFFESEVTIWGVPGDPSHDTERGICLGPEKEVCNVSEGQQVRPFLTSPRACQGPLATGFHATSWQGASYTGSTFTDRGFEDCAKVGFSPAISAQTTDEAAASPSGLDFELNIDDPGLSSPEEEAVAGSDIKRAVLTLPEGMTANPSLAEGLATCSEADLGRESADSQFGEGCPAASKIGTVEVKTPLLEDETIGGQVYVAKPYENPFGSLIALYIVLQDPGLGISVKLAGEVTPDPQTGQLTSVFGAPGHELPQLPISDFRVHLREGARSPLITPPGCGEHTLTADFTPWAHPAQTVERTAQLHVGAGPGGGPCPTGAPFAPDFAAGTLNNQAGSYSPFLMRLTRQDGEQDMGRFSFVLPPGVVPKLAGIPYCSDAQIALARSRSGPHGGQEELDHPSCPAASQIGTTLAGAGVGSQLTYASGKLYLAGPYHGDPISAVAIVPALAGPFDAGTVVVREALRLNPVTHVGEVDGSASDPIPHILKGIPLEVREVRVSADKPEFTLNPTSCEPFAASSTIWGDGTALEPLPEHPVNLSSRFQAAGCASLGFKPKLGLKLRGGTRRGKFPALHAVYTPRPGDANLSRLALTFPHSEFIEQGHFRTICTRVQFAAGAGFGSQCPKGSIYGHIKVWTPLLSEPLQGPVYLRSSNHNLPDAVFALHGLVDIELATRIDSTHGRLRAIVDGAPDAPVSRAVVNMQGGQKGLFVNSRNLCFKPGRNRANVDLEGQNGRRVQSRPVMRALKCRKAHRKRHKRHARRARRSRRGAGSRS